MGPHSTVSSPTISGAATKAATRFPSRTAPAPSRAKDLDVWAILAKR